MVWRLKRSPLEGIISIGLPHLHTIPMADVELFGFAITRLPRLPSMQLSIKGGYLLIFKWRSRLKGERWRWVWRMALQLPTLIKYRSQYFCGRRWNGQKQAGMGRLAGGFPSIFWARATTCCHLPLCPCQTHFPHIYFWRCTTFVGW